MTTRVMLSICHKVIQPKNNHSKITMHTNIHFLLHVSAFGLYQWGLIFPRKHFFASMEICNHGQNCPYNRL